MIKGDRVIVIATDDEEDLPVGWTGNIVAVSTDGATCSAFFDQDAKDSPPAYDIPVKFLRKV